MGQILLNDPNRSLPGGSSALDLLAEQGVLGYYNAARLALWAEDVNAMFAELYNRSAPLFQQPTPFSLTVPLMGQSLIMPRQSVTGPMVFVPGASPVFSPTGGVILELVSNGVNTPDFSAFTSQNPPNNWASAAGTVNRVVFSYSSTEVATYWLSYTGVFPGIASISLTHGVNPTLTIATNGTTLNPAYVPPASAFSLADTDGVTIGSVSVTSSAIQLSLVGTVAADDTLTLSYTPPVLNGFIAGLPYGPAQDANGNQLAAFGSAAVTVN